MMNSYNFNKLTLCKESTRKVYKPSKYNVIHEMNGGIVLFNTLTGAIAILDDRMIVDYYLRDNGKSISIQNEPTEVERNLIENGFIVPEELDELQFYIYAENFTKFLSEELYIVLLPTRACNFKCPYCFEASEATKMSEKDIESVLYFIKNLLKTGKYKKLSLSWYGGEPLLAKDIITELGTGILELTKEFNIQLEAGITTNGFFLDDDTASELEKLHVKWIQITIHPGEESHNKLRPTKEGKPTYEKVKQAILTATRYFEETRVRLHIEKEGIKYLKRFLEEEKDWLMHPRLRLEPAYVIDDSTGFCFLSRTKETLGVSVSYDEYIRASELVMEFNRKKYGINNDAGDYLEKMLSSTLAPRFGYCGALHNHSYVIGPKGLLYKCISAVDPGDEIGKIEGNYLVVNHNFFEWINYSPAKEKPCQQCKFLPFCAGG
ncbi:MAG: radical SAM protein, partial [candidate division WOR-3 bacterium]